MSAIFTLGSDHRACRKVTASIVLLISLWCKFARGMLIALFGAVLAWSMFAKLGASPLAFLLLITVTGVTGFVGGLISNASSFWLCALVAIAYWIGEMVALGTSVSLGDTTRQFVLSLLALNGCPLLAGSAVVPGNSIAGLTQRRQSRPSLGA